MEKEIERRRPTDVSHAEGIQLEVARYLMAANIPLKASPLDTMVEF